MSEQICTNQRVYPLRPTAVNRGYQDGMLDSSGHLLNFTSACGPLLYRGDQISKQFQGNAFVCGPEGNLVKRNRILTQMPKVSAQQLYDDREFLAATDPAFRPVNLSDGPDGSLYIVDMHHGILQHKTYMTAYLRDKLTSSGLDTVVNMGRILRVRKTLATHPLAPQLNGLKTQDLIQLLHYPNGWVRDRAQQMLIDRADPETAAALLRLLGPESEPLFSLHTLWALEGLQQQDTGLLLRMCQHNDPMVVATALQLLAAFPASKVKAELAPILPILQQRKDASIDLALCLYGASAGTGAYPVLAMLARQYAADGFYRDAMVSGLAQSEASFAAYLQQSQPGCDTLLTMLHATAKARANEKKPRGPYFVPRVGMA
ncbi:MAG: hypothetical protein IPL65_01235 [Lewinellaceae bacterium]|nr:hypothetical protein [Lewinellaceae bacterium]